MISAETITSRHCSQKLKDNTRLNIQFIFAVHATVKETQRGMCVLLLLFRICRIFKTGQNPLKCFFPHQRLDFRRLLFFLKVKADDDDMLWKLINKRQKFKTLFYRETQPLSCLKRTQKTHHPKQFIINRKLFLFLTQFSSREIIKRVKNKMCN